MYILGRFTRKNHAIKSYQDSYPCITNSSDLQFTVMVPENLLATLDKSIQRLTARIEPISRSRLILLETLLLSMCTNVPKLPNLRDFSVIVYSVIVYKLFKLVLL